LCFQQKHRSFHSIIIFDTLSNSEGVLYGSATPHLTASWRQPWWSYSFRFTNLLVRCFRLAVNKFTEMPIPSL